jgi:hypothetical protein
MDSLPQRSNIIFVINKLSRRHIKYPFYQLCQACKKYSGSRIMEQINDGVKEHTPWKWLSHLQLVEVVSRISAKCNDEKLEVLNLMRKLM